MSGRNAIRCAILLLLVNLAGSCGRHAPTWSAGLCALDGVPVSAALRPYLDSSIALLDQPDPDRDSVRQYAAYWRLQVQLRPMETRAAATGEVYARWRADPRNVLWLNFAFGYRHLFDRPDDLARMLADPALSDTTTALGAYARGATTLQAAPRNRWYRKAAGLQSRLTPLSRTQLTLRLANIDRAEGHTTAAVQRLLNGLPSAFEAGGRALTAYYWYQVGRRLASDDRLDDALHAVAIAAALARAADQQYLQLAVEIQIATIRSQRGEFETARERLGQVATRADSLNFPWLVQSSLDRASRISCDSGDYRHAIKLDRRALAYAIRLRDSLNAPRSLASIAHDYRMLGQLDSTYVYLQQAQAIVDTAGVPSNQRKMSELMAGYYCQVGRYAQAESALVAAAGLNDAMGTRLTRAKLLLELVPSALEIGRTDLAYEWLGRVARDRDVLPRTELYFNFLADFETLSARLYADQGEIQLAAEALQQARAAVTNSGGEGKRWLLEAQTGDLALQRGDPRRAEQAFMACLDIALQGEDPRQIDRSRFQLGQLYLQQGDFANAEALFAPLGDANTFGHGYRTGLTSLLLLGLTKSEQGQPQAALTYYNEGLSRLNSRSPADLLLRFHLARAQARTSLHRYDEAAAELAQVLATLDEKPHLVRFADLPVFRTDIGRDARAALVHNLVARSTAPDRPAGAPSLEVMYPGLADRLRNEPCRGPALVFAVGAERSWAWLVTADRITVDVLPARKQLQALLTPVLVDLARADRPVDTSRLAVLAQLLLGPVAESWTTGATLTLVPDDLLRQVPWAALPFGSGVALDQGPIRELSPAASPPADPPEHTPRDLSLIAIGCNEAAAPRRSDTAPLREAEAEAAVIAQLWPGPRADLVTGRDANWPDLLSRGLESYGTIHIASHAVVHQGIGHRSTLRLATAQSGVTTPITTTAVKRLHLRADLVFLSSCRAGLPGADAGGGDFTEAFLAAGAHTVIASNAWVDDEAARALATSFYRNWCAGSGKAKALQIARREIRDRWPHPAYWAFWRLVGEDR